mmetsp:Transcript_10529/g.15808  ORF Transcript_10529/g.15808 Transcript_10529/m.15808 type:complete len:271 (-) Transcript_10529:180-992(-)|eukprot:CAMPEP_0116028404 /NCGR_PEP_ID=MMETSP0321-20121206/15377_1 /TAXON_ID=163516 /ORGANISM="Leptocylindrus danicus var. danicus, Strain B650" /LENGTH=270 /DNA_ID=CAMNT_0003502289 /DNA_START=114 /DNA_END=926 /DNA_ORIENTATION=-
MTNGNKSIAVSNPSHPISVVGWLNLLDISPDVANRIRIELPFVFPVNTEAVESINRCIGETICEEKIQLAKHLGEKLNAMGMAKAKQGLWQEALTIWGDALHVQKVILGSENSDVACTLNNIGIAMFWLGRVELALNALEQALRVRRTVFGDSHLDVAATHHNIGNILMRKCDYFTALRSFQEELRIKKQLISKSGKDTGNCDLTQAFLGIGNAYLKMSRFQEAKSNFQDALKVFKDLDVSDDHPEVVRILRDTTKCDLYESRAKRLPRI